LIVIEVETSPSGMPSKSVFGVGERVDRDALATNLAEARRAWSES